ncbi:hypothetical protein AV530_010095 [Patagioenas fasciata monilis]|uniref:Uncharacterized protein n=1 Tax=Patagioenas fasciata monilis TaxID=372326 RepID=A0A1V4KTW7_PATFA|nr:hypothetical protein AV530_010095 [Patagioenas fasciata monilis]
MSQLGARLEEKRRAIEAQKRRIEAIFAKHRQRLGRSAFLQLHGGDHEDDAGGGEASKDKKQVTFAPPAVPTPRYEAAVAKLSSALDSLQSDMERLSRQQQRLLRDPPGHAWIIPVAKSQGGTVPPPPKGGTPAATKTPGSPSPARKAGGTTPRKTPPPPPAPRSPRRARPVELKLPPLNRVLTPPHDVDTLPHLRRFSPSSVPVQTRCSIHFDDDIGDNGDSGDGDNRAGAVVAKPPPPDSPEPPELGSGGVVDAPRPMGTPRVSGDGTSDASSPGERREVTVTHGDEDEEEEEEEEGLGDSLEGSPTQGGGGRDTRSSMGFFFTWEDNGGTWG